MEYLVFVVVVAASLAIWFNFIKEEKFSVSRDQLYSEGFTHTFSGTGDQFISFNLSNGYFRAGSLADYSYIEKPVSYISNYEWKWVSRNAEKVANKFLFYISDVDFYMHEIFFGVNQRQAEIEWARLESVILNSVSAQSEELSTYEREAEYDYFISYAKEDDEGFVAPLVSKLRERGLRVWYDATYIGIGDGIRESIDQGLKNSTFGIVVLSKAFFKKNWTQYELDALTNRSISGRKVILPIWHDVDLQEVSRFSHSLADKRAFSTKTFSIEKMADEFLRLIQNQIELSNKSDEDG